MIAEADRDAVADLLTAFGWHADQHDAEGLCALFLPHASLRAGQSVASGQQELLAYAQRRLGQSSARTRHLWSNLHLQEGDTGEVLGRALQQTFEQLNNGVVELRVNDLSDVFKRDEKGRWRFLSRTIDRQFQMHLQSGDAK